MNLAQYITILVFLFSTAETFFDEKRGECWYRCQPPRGKCSKDTCDGKGDEMKCYGKKTSDDVNCHFFKYCYMDKDTNFKWVECRFEISPSTFISIQV